MGRRGKTPLDLIGADKYPDKAFRWVRQNLLSDREYIGYQVVKCSDFPDLRAGHNDASVDAGCITHRELILVFRPKELEDERLAEKRKDVMEQTLLNNGIPTEYTKKFGNSMEAVEAMDKAPSGYKPGTGIKVPKVF